VNPIYQVDLFEKVHDFIRHHNGNLDTQDMVRNTGGVHPDSTGAVFQHNLDEEKRVLAQQRMAAFYKPCLEAIIKRYYLEGELPLFSNMMLSSINRCNGTCSFCGASSLRDKRKLKILPREVFEKILEELVRLDYGGRITMQGLNEPFMDKRMVWFCQQINEKLPKARIHIITNGTLLSQEMLWELLPIIKKLHINCYNDELKISASVSGHYRILEDNPYRGKVKISLRKQNELLSQIGLNECGRTLKSTIDCSCILPFNTISIAPSGKVNLCMADLQDVSAVGSVWNSSLVEIWYGQALNERREKIARGRCHLDFCRTCDVFCF
jgi:organic radical activating enzyme